MVAAFAWFTEQEWAFHKTTRSSSRCVKRYGGAPCAVALSDADRRGTVVAARVPREVCCARSLDDGLRVDPAGVFPTDAAQSGATRGGY